MRNFLKNANLIKEDIFNTNNPTSNVQSEQDKLRDTLKKFYNDRMQLQCELEKEAAAHKNDIERLTTELSNLKKKFSELAENIANQPLEATADQIETINKLNDDINAINIKTKTLKSNYIELQLNNEVLKKQSKEYQTKVDQLQEDLQSSDRYQHDLIALKTKLSQLEDDLFEKNHSIKQHEQTIQWNDHELRKLEQQIEHMLSQRTKFTFASGDCFSISQPIFNFHDLCSDIYNEINKSTNHEIATDEILSDFLLLIPKKISELESENEKLMLKSTKYRREFSRLQIIANRSNNEESKSKNSSQSSQINLPPPEKLKETINKLKHMINKKDESIKQFESIISRQNQAIQKVQMNPSKNTALALSMRNIFTQIKEYNRSTDRKELCLQGVRILDAMLNSS